MHSKNITYYQVQLEYALGVPFIDGNRLKALQNGAEIFPAMLAAIAQAQDSVDFETFVYWQGDIARRFADALAAKAREGKTVRVLLDAFGAKTISVTLVEKMQSAGVEVRWFRPLATWRLWRNDKRTHRKILVIDDRIGFTGGVGIAEEWEGNASNPSEWRETHFKLDGPAVRGLKSAFLDNWNEAGDWTWDGQRTPTPAHPDGEPVQIVRASSTIGWTEMASLLRALVSVSRQSLTIVTAYFVPDAKLVDILCAAAQRGVEVRLLLPGKYIDKRLPQLAGQLSFERLLAGGVKIWIYQRTMLHAKLMTVDGTLACVGSANLNHRSLGKDEECCAVVLSPALAAELESDFIADCSHAEQLTLAAWKGRSTWLRAKERLARLLIEQL
ncbi:cardiolipin synthase B [Exilibacterium tricleocarpae]|uniref:Cardiolipin synthase B n=1 Tax=Exilibacterium tricleocarpae TaxID=2591008 RepID=A0A545TNL4_9GAMM|nr:phospholipase D-like domain-containing protein [Exilibacterium tricleocarpae]TQV78809.1 cardiolipin synthase B [Exilibacterium tricleocarpae]